MDGKTFEPALVQVAKSNRPVRPVPALRMRNSDPFHKLGQVAVVTRPKYQMPVIVHNAITANAHSKLLCTLGQYPFECFEVTHLLEYSQPAVRTVKDMINDITFCYSYESGHKRKLYDNISICQHKKVSDPFN